MNITNLDYVGDYTILYFICKYSAIVLAFVILNIMLVTKEKERKSNKFRTAILTSAILTLLSCIGWAGAGIVRNKNISNFTSEIQRSISIDYEINSNQAYSDIIKLYDYVAVGKDFVTDDFVVYNKITEQDEKVRLEYKNGVLKIRGIL